MVEIIMSETIADIVAEMRKDIPRVVDAKVILRNYADRIEEVTKCNQPEPVTNCNGLNAAKMREALEEITEFLDTWKDHLCGTIGEEAQEHINKAEAALTAPARNCDKCLTPKDAMLAHLEEVYEGEKVEFGDYEWCEFFKWLFAEAKEFTNK